MTATYQYKPTAQLTDNELLCGIEAAAKERFDRAWERGACVQAGIAHRDLVPGESEYDGFHRIIVRYMLCGCYAYFYRTGPFTWPTQLEGRDAALEKVKTYRAREVR